MISKKELRAWIFMNTKHQREGASYINPNELLTFIQENERECEVIMPRIEMKINDGVMIIAETYYNDIDHIIIVKKKNENADLPKDIQDAIKDMERVEAQNKEI